MASLSENSDLENGLQPERQLPPLRRLSKQLWGGVVALFGGGVSILKIDSGAETLVQTYLVEKATSHIDTVLQNMQSSVNGLTTANAAEQLKKFGPNILSNKKGNRWYEILWNAAWHPFNLILLTLAVISAVTSDMATFSLMCAMIILSVGLRFQQELKTSRAATRLALMVQMRTSVLRCENGSEKGIEMEIDQSDLVPGDIVVLRMGDVVPGDLRLLTSKDLCVSQSSLTGESMPVEKFADTVEDKTAPLLDLKCICFMGTSVISGEGTGVVVSTGNKTYINTVAVVLNSKTPTNAFQNGVRRVSFLLVCFMLVMVPIVIVISGVSTHSWSSSFLFGISVAVGLTPEMLPMIVNANLARGALEMARKKCIVKRVDAVQNMGAMDILCTDKTGTLTIDQVVLVQYTDHCGIARPHVFKYGYLNSFFQTGLSNVIDKSILAYGTNEEVDVSNWTKIDEFPFDFERRRLSVVLEEKSVEAHKEPIQEVDKKQLLVTKGALEEMLSICSFVQEGESEDSMIPLTTELCDSLLKKGQDLNLGGLRVLVVATKCRTWPKEGLKVSTYKYGDECDMVFQGFLAFLDPPKESAKPAIESLTRKGVAIKVLTGDNLSTAVKVCEGMGIPTDHVVTGPELPLKATKAFRDIVQKATILAKLTPSQKLEVVQALRAGNHTVGFLGDGINDALALKAADVGISVDSASSVAKDAAEIILLEKDLNVLAAGVVRGRITHGNTIKYIKMAASSNFGNVFSILVASAWLPFDPMRPIQILTQNLLYDISQVSIPWDKMDIGYTDWPRQWSAKGIAKFMVCMGPVSSIFDITTFNLMWWYYGARTKEHQALLQTAWFVEGLLSQTLVIHTLRTAKIPFIQETASKTVLIVTSLVVMVGISLPFTPLGKAEKMVHLPASYFGFLAIILSSYCCLAQVCKMLYIHYFKTWL